MKYPEHKFILTLSLIACFYTAISFIVYLLSHTLHWDAYFLDVFKMSSSILFGFVFIYFSLKTTSFKITYRQNQNDVKHMSLDLLSAIPEAPYIEEGIHPLESEIITALKAYKNYPGKTGLPLYTSTHKKWEKVKSIPNATHLHRIMSLSEDLASLYAYKMSQTHPPLWQFWKRGDVSVEKIGKPTTSLNAHILSRFPSFKTLSTKEQNTLLYALKFQNPQLKKPTNIPEESLQLIQFVAHVKAEN